MSPRCRLDQRATSRAPRAPLCEGEPWGLEGRQRSRNGGGWEEVTVASVVTAGGAIGRRVQLGQGRGCLTRWNFPGVTTASQRVPPRGGGAAPQSLGPQVRRSPLADLPPACRPGPRFTGHCQPPAGLSSFWPRGSVLGLPQATPSGLPVPCRSRSPSAPAPQGERPCASFVARSPRDSTAAEGQPQMAVQPRGHALGPSLSSLARAWLAPAVGWGAGLGTG